MPAALHAGTGTVPPASQSDSPERLASSSTSSSRPTRGTTPSPTLPPLTEDALLTLTVREEEKAKEQGRGLP